MNSSIHKHIWTLFHLPMRVMGKATNEETTAIDAFVSIDYITADSNAYGR